MSVVVAVLVSVALGYGWGRVDARRAERRRVPRRPPRDWQRYVPGVDVVNALLLPCALVHAPEIRCAVCAPPSDEYRNLPAFIHERLRIARELPYPEPEA